MSVDAPTSVSADMGAPTTASSASRRGSDSAVNCVSVAARVAFTVERIPPPCLAMVS